MPQRTATVEWTGTLREGSGDVRLTSSPHPLGFGFSTRFEEQPGSNPEELLAGALGSCFTMALAGRLTRGETPPGILRTSAKATIEKVEGEWTITEIELQVGGHVEGISQEGFEAHAHAAKQACPVSRALQAVPIRLVVDRLGI